LRGQLVERRLWPESVKEFDADWRAWKSEKGLLDFTDLIEQGEYSFPEPEDRGSATLSALGDVAFIDTRVLLAHRGLHPSRPDRFLSDLGRFEEIEDPFLHQFTEAATGAPTPVILGGHSLVSGGLMALIEAAWREHDRAVDAR